MPIKPVYASHDSTDKLASLASIAESDQASQVNPDINCYGGDFYQIMTNLLELTAFDVKTGLTGIFRFHSLIKGNTIRIFMFLGPLPCSRSKRKYLLLLL